MEKILKFSSPKAFSPYMKRPPKINTQTYYSEYEDEDTDHFIDHSNHGPYVKIYTKKETSHSEPTKAIYETDQEPNVSVNKEHLEHQHHSQHKHIKESSPKSSHFKGSNPKPTTIASNPNTTPPNPNPNRRRKNQKKVKDDEAHSGDKIKNIYYNPHKDDKLKDHPFRHLIFSPHIPEQIFKRHLNMLYRGLLYAKNCLKGPSESFLEKKKITLTAKPGKENLKTLFLDLDETLIHSCSHREKNTFVIKIYDEDNQPSQQAFKIRPHCREFLQEMSQIFEIYIFTASQISYASSIMEFIDPGSKFISGILDRSKCLKTKNGFFIKDLRIIKNRDLKNMIIVDNLAHSFGFQITNGVPILEWHDSFKDQELLYLKNYLKEVVGEEDVREFNEKRLKLNELGCSRKEDLHI